MYEELVKLLRACAELHGECALCKYQGNGCDAMPETPPIQAADAIEELSAKYEKALADLVKQVGPPKEEV